MAPTPPPKRVGGTAVTPRWAKVRETALKAIKIVRQIISVDTCNYTVVE